MSRLFFGLEVPADIRQRLLRVTTPVSGARWQSGEQLHVTLLFLGDVAQGRTGVVCDAAANLTVGAFELELAGLGCFGQPHRPRYLWAGIQPRIAISRLRDALAVGMADLGFTPDPRAFCPHVTLARFGKQPGSVEALVEEYRKVVFGHFAVSEFVLFESTPGEHGSIYHVVERFALTESPPAPKD